MGWISLPNAKLPEEGHWTVTYRVSAEGEVEIQGYNVDAQLRQSITDEIPNLRGLIGDLRTAGRAEDADYLVQITDRLVASR